MVGIQEALPTDRQCAEGGRDRESNGKKANAELFTGLVWLEQNNGSVEEVKC